MADQKDPGVERKTDMTGHCPAIKAGANENRAIAIDNGKEL